MSDLKGSLDLNKILETTAVVIAFIAGGTESAKLYLANQKAEKARPAQVEGEEDGEPERHHEGAEES